MTGGSGSAVSPLSDPGSMVGGYAGVNIEDPCYAVSSTASEVTCLGYLYLSVTVVNTSAQAPSEGGGAGVNGSY